MCLTAAKKFVNFRFDYSPPSSRHLDPFNWYQSQVLHVKLNRLELRCRTQVIKSHLSPEVIPSTMLLAHHPFLKEATLMPQARVIKRMDVVMSPPIVRTKSSMMHGPPAPLDDHQGIILEPLSIILTYPLTIHRVLATLGRYPI
jgi:hypothetical protein